MRSFLVIGLGRFGRHLALKLSELDGEVLAVDADEANVEAVAEFVTRSQIADCTDEAVMKSFGVGNFDVCFMCVGSDFARALEITLMLRENGAKRIVAKTDNERHGKLLIKCGADEIVYPERDEAYRAARKSMTDYAFDSFPLSPEFAIYETEAIPAWCEKTIGELALRAKYNINVVGVMRNGKLVPITNADFTFRRGENIVLAGAVKDISRLLSRV